MIERPEELFRRVARHIAIAEKSFASKVTADEAEARFYDLMSRLEFLPNSPTLMNAGTPLGQLSACFVVPVQDSMEGIFQALTNMAKIHQTGGGTGFSFSNLRPHEDLVRSTKGQASGPVSFMSIFDQATGVIVQGGRRRGANMGVMRVDHPDIEDFIQAKLKKGRFSNFNLSVGITGRFLEAYKKNQSFDLINPRTEKVVRSLKARPLFDFVVECAWKTGDPGLVFLDEINRKNPLPGAGPIETTNPCGELPLLDYESCNLGSINLARMVHEKALDWKKLAETIRWGVRFLDDVIEVNQFPLPEIKQITLSNRKIGLGVMGFADMLIALGISYNSKPAISFAEKLMRFIRAESVKASIELARERGVFPNYAHSIYVRKKMRLRNATVNSIAPTGTISMIADCSSGIEPIFAVSFVRNVLGGVRLKEKREVPRGKRHLFVTAHDVPARQHLEIQAAFQRYTDNAVSKTINLPRSARPADVKKIFLLAAELRVKGITIYRYGSHQDQVLTHDDAPGCTKHLCAF